MLETKNACQILPEKQLPSGSVVGRRLCGLCCRHGRAHDRTAPSGQLFLGGCRWVPTGIDGNTVFGCYADPSNTFRPFLYDIPTATYTTLNIDLPGPIWMTGGISDNTIVGIYNDTVNDNNHGFVAIIPEPSTFALLTAGAIGLAAYGRWRRKQ
jgi:hypothetical protein